jgi:hypothetical protein
VDGFRAQGLAHDAGLDNLMFGSRYPGKGFPNTSELNIPYVTITTGVYTHFRPARNTCYYPDRRVTSPSRLWILPSQGHRVRAAWRPITSNAPSKA